MRCYNCGTTLKDEARFCSRCGQEQGFSEELIQRARRGEQDALSELYRRTYTAVYQTAAVLVRDEDRALDILQDSYLKAFRNLDQLKEADKFRAWVKRIAHNQAVDYLRQTKPVVFSRMSYDSDEAVEFADDRVENLPEEVIDQRETARLMEEILDSLSPEQRAVIVMFYYEQMSVKQIAQDLGVNENTVKSRLLHGRRQVETAVKGLEKKGTKLYGLAPIPFLLVLCRGWEVQAAPVQALGALDGILRGFYAGAGAMGAAGAGGAGVAGSGVTGTSAAAGTGGAGMAAGTAGIGGASAAAGAAGKGIFVKVLIGLLVVGIGGGAAGTALYYTQKEPETVYEEELPEQEAPEEAEEPEEKEEQKPSEPEENEEANWKGEVEVLGGSWEGFAHRGDENYVMTLGFDGNGQVEYMAGWRNSDVSLMSTGTYRIEGKKIHLTFETNELTQEHLGWESTYWFTAENGALKMKWESGDGINDFQEEGMTFGYSKTSIFTQSEQRYICEQLHVPENVEVTIETGEEYYWEGANMTLIPVSVYRSGTYVAGADVNVDTKEAVRSIMSYQY